MKAQRSQRRIILRPYLVAVAASVLAGALSLAVPEAHESPIFFISLAAIFAGAWIGGLGPGLVATALNVAFYWFVILPPTWSFRLGGPGDLIRVIAYAGTAVSGAVVVARLRDEQWRTRELLLQESEARTEAEEAKGQLTSVLESIGDAFFSLDSEWRFTYLNRHAENLLGVSRAQLMGRVLWEEFPQARGTVFERNYETVMRERKPIAFDADYAPLKLSIAVRAYPKDDGGVSVFFIDIGERKRLEAEVESNAQRFERTFNLASVGIAHVGFDGHWIRVNERLCEILGYSREEMLGLTFQDITNPADLTKDLDQFERLKHGEIDSYSIEKRFIGRTGATVWVNLSASLMQEPSGSHYAISVMDDITAKKEAEEELRRLSAIVNWSDSAIFAKTLDGIIVTWNPGAERLYGYTAAEAIGRSVAMLVPEGQPDDTPALLARLAMGERIGQLETVRRKNDGTQVEVSLNISPIRDAGGQIVGASTIARDISDRRMAERALRESEARFRTMYEQTSVGIEQVAMDGRFLMVNEALVQMLGYSAGELEHMTFDQITYPDDREREAALLCGLLSGETRSYDLEKRYLRKDGTPLWVQINSSLVRNDENQPAYRITVVQDISRRKGAEQALIRNEKLVSVARMAATIAHEINNPLETVINAVYLAGINPAVPDDARQHLAMAERELERVAHITRQSLGFYRESGKPTRVQAGRVTDEVARLYEARLNSRDIELLKRYRGKMEVEMIEGELRQIVSNLIGNSFDAINGSGKIYIRVWRSSLASHDAAVCLTVADTGSGIARENLSKIFEPFFTTKADLGTGLGLWVTKQLVQKYGGRIRVRSCGGKGTVFTVWLPVTAEVPDEPVREPMA